MECTKFKYIKNNDIIIEKNNGDVTYVLNIENDQCYELDSVSKYIWDNIEDKTFFQITDSVVKEFNADKTVVETDTEDFLNDLIRNKLICTIEG